MRRAIQAALTAGALVAVLTGCGASHDSSGDTISQRGNDYLTEHTVQLDDGRVVTCIAQSNGGLACDWANAE